jgi:hypothetical protein
MTSARNIAVVGIPLVLGVGPFVCDRHDCIVGVRLGGESKYEEFRLNKAYSKQQRKANNPKSDCLVLDGTPVRAG